MCRRWRKDFLNFYKDMGSRPSNKHSIDRIDNNGPYAPWNCRWATTIEQARNKGNNTHIQYKGETKLLIEWSNELGISAPALCHRFDKGMSVREVFEKPTRRIKQYQYGAGIFTATEIAKMIGMNVRTFIQRVNKYNWAIEKAISTPTNQKCNWRNKSGVEHKQSKI